LVAAVFAAVPLLHPRRAAELGAEDDERLL
jgi:hypothetical protein